MYLYASQALRKGLIRLRLLFYLAQFTKAMGALLVLVCAKGGLEKIFRIRARRSFSRTPASSPPGHVKHQLDHRYRIRQDVWSI